MAQFMATIQGNRGEASRLGSKDSGIRARVNGWNSGIEVSGRFDKKTDRDIFSVYQTGGSNGRDPSKFIGDFALVDGELVKL